MFKICKRKLVVLLVVITVIGFGVTTKSIPIFHNVRTTTKMSHTSNIKDIVEDSKNIEKNNTGKDIDSSSDSQDINDDQVNMDDNDNKQELIRSKAEKSSNQETEKQKNTKADSQLTDASNNENIEKKNFYNRENSLEKNYYMQDKNNGIEKNIRGEKMQSENRIKIISINKQIHLISESNKIENEIEVVKKIKNEKENYDVILIDIENEMQNYFSVLLEEIDKIIFLTEANVLQIKKSKMYLEEMIENYKMEKEKINFVCNKIKAETLSFNILKNVLREYNILGKINDVKNSNLLINHNMKNIFLEKEIQSQYQKIGNEILKNKNAKKYYINKIE